MQKKQIHLRKPKTRPHPTLIEFKRKWSSQIKLLLIILVSALFTACGGDLTDELVKKSAPVEIESAVRTQSIRKTLETGSPLIVSRAIHSPVPENSNAPLFLPESSSQAGQAQQGSMTHSLKQSASPIEFMSHLHWNSTTALTGDEQFAIARFSLPGAQRTRLALDIVRLPTEGKLRLRSQQEEIEVAYSTIQQAINRNKASAADHKAAQLYWLPSIPGDSIQLEMVMPNNASRADLLVGAPYISEQPSHVEKAPEFDLNYEDAACTSCHGPEIDAVVQVNYQWHSWYSGNKGFGTCSGTLLNNVREDFTPYILTAHHCINDQEIASSVEVLWGHHSTSCGSEQCGRNFARISGGAELLYSDATTDVALLRLNAPAPLGAVFAGWDTTEPQIGEHVKGIHHPYYHHSTGYRLEFTKPRLMSSGKFTGNARYRFLGSEPVYREGLGYWQYLESDHPVYAKDAPYRVVSVEKGTMAVGSSGSPLFAQKEGAWYVIGQLHGGWMDEKPQMGPMAFYGRFDLSYHQGLHQWLGADLPPSDVPIKR